VKETPIIRPRKNGRLYFGWWITVVNAVITGLAGGFRTQGFSALFKPIGADLGLSRAAVSTAPGISAILNGLTFAVAGWLADRIGPRWIIVCGTVITAAGLMLMAGVDSALEYNIVWGVIIAGGTTLGFSVAQDKMLTDWFVGKRGMAFGTRFAIMGAMAAGIVPLLSWLIIAFGWRKTCFVWGCVLLLAVPFELCFTRQKRPEHYGLLPDGAKPESETAGSEEDSDARGRAYVAAFEESEFSFVQALKTSSYWLLAATWVLQFAIWQSVIIHCIPLLTDRGIEPVRAGGMMSLMILCAIPSRFLGGILADRFQKERMKFLLSAAFILTAFGLSALLLTRGTAGLHLFLCLVGLGSGAVIPVDIVIKGRFFGRKAYGSIQGSTVMLSTPIAFLAPVYAGWVFDATGTYRSAVTLFMTVSVINAFLVLLVHPPRAPGVNDVQLKNRVSHEDTKPRGKDEGSEIRGRRSGTI